MRPTRLVGVKSNTQNNFVFGKFGRTNYQTRRCFNILKYWLKIIRKSENKYVNVTNKLMLRDIYDNVRIVNWASLVRKILCNLGFYEVWLNQYTFKDCKATLT